MIKKRALGRICIPKLPVLGGIAVWGTLCR